MAGKIVHFEVAAEDADRAQAFYERVFGWTFGDSGMPGVDYRLTRTGDEQGGAVYASEERSGHLTVYFDTDDVDESLAQVREAGGKADEKQPIPGIGWFARVTDTEGNAFSLFQGDESATMG